MSIQVFWYGHSCFALEADGSRLVLDPFADGSVPGLPALRLTANAVLCSHEHGDHHGTEGVTLASAGNGPFLVEKIPSFHDAQQGRLRGRNTIHRITCQGMSIVHLGDLGHVLSEESAQKLSEPDLLMIPVGGHYTIDAAEAARVVEQLHPRVIIPMHYRRGGVGYDVIETVGPFLSHFGIWKKVSNPFVLEKETHAQIAVMEPYLLETGF